MNATSEYQSDGQGVITIDTAPFQADPSITDAAIRGGCEAILSSDSDFSMYPGPGGPDKCWRNTSWVNPNAWCLSVVSR